MQFLVLVFSSNFWLFCVDLIIFVLIQILINLIKIISPYIFLTNSVLNVAYMCINCLLYTSPSPRDRTRYRMPSSA